MKAIVDVNYPILKGIFDVGDIVEIERVVSTHREVLSTKKVEYTKTDTWGKPYKGYRVEEDLVREKGEYIGYRIKSKNGHYYTDQCFLNAIGYKSLGEIFSKVDKNGKTKWN